MGEGVLTGEIDQNTSSGIGSKMSRVGETDLNNSVWCFWVLHKVMHHMRNTRMLFFHPCQLCLDQNLPRDYIKIWRQEL